MIRFKQSLLVILFFVLATVQLVRETLLMEHSALIEQGAVVPGNPSACELYNRLVTTDIAKQMSLGQPQPWQEATSLLGGAYRTPWRGMGGWKATP